MSKYLVHGAYTRGSWTRMMNTPDDRIGAVEQLVQGVGGTVEFIAWEVGTGVIYVICDLPGSRSIVAGQLTAFQTGGYTYIQAHELLTEEQLLAGLDKASDVAPGITAATGVESSITADDAGQPPAPGE